MSFDQYLGAFITESRELLEAMKADLPRFESCGGRRIGLVADELAGQMQAVIKPLPPMFSHLRGMAGSTILGNGNIALILDVPGLIEQILLQTHATAGAHERACDSTRGARPTPFWTATQRPTVALTGPRQPARLQHRSPKMRVSKMTSRIEIGRHAAHSLQITETPGARRRRRADSMRARYGSLQSGESKW